MDDYEVLAVLTWEVEMSLGGCWPKGGSGIEGRLPL